MYNITENHKLQVTRRVYDEAQAIVVFHVYVVNETSRNEWTDYVELRNGVSKGLRIPEDYANGPDGNLIEAYDTDNMTYFDSAQTSLGTETEPSDTEAEEYLIAIGVLPAAFVPEEVE